MRRNGVQYEFMARRNQVVMATHMFTRGESPAGANSITQRFVSENPARRSPGQRTRAHPIGRRVRTQDDDEGEETCPCKVSVDSDE